MPILVRSVQEITNRKQNEHVAKNWGIILKRNNNLIEMTAEIVLAYLKRNPIGANEIPDLIADIHNSLIIRSSRHICIKTIPDMRGDDPDHLVCIEDSSKFRPSSKVKKTMEHKSKKLPPLALTSLQVRRAQKIMALGEKPLADLCKEFRIQPGTLYTYVSPGDALNDNGKR